MSNMDVEETFKYLLYDARLATFKSWAFDRKAGVICSSTNLAQAGFIKTDKNSTMCVFCNKELVWDEPTEDPFKEHEDHSTACPFLPYMRLPESEWKADELMTEVLATLATHSHIKTLNEYINECDIAFKKASSKLSPYFPSE